SGSPASGASASTKAFTRWVTSATSSSLMGKPPAAASARTCSGVSSVIVPRLYRTRRAASSVARVRPARTPSLTRRRSAPIVWPPRQHGQRRHFPEALRRRKEKSHGDLHHADQAHGRGAEDAEAEPQPYQGGQQRGRRDGRQDRRAVRGSRPVRLRQRRRGARQQDHREDLHGAGITGDHGDHDVGGGELLTFGEGLPAGGRGTPP